MNAFLLLLFAGLAGVLVSRSLRKVHRQSLLAEPFPPVWRRILGEKVTFYRSLTPEERQRFEFKVREFLLDCQVTGVELEVTVMDKVLVAASGVIPVFAFPDWRYRNLDEVLLYPSRINLDFESGQPDSSILGMVGTGPLDRKLLLSRKALYHGFSNDRDKRNTAIHEFVHLIDKLDGKVDGIPAVLLERPYVLPWLDLIERKLEEIRTGQSDIHPYGGTSPTEFYAVVSEYFFERPKLLERKHPTLYAMLEEIFDHDLAERNLARSRMEIGRNSPCPCGSDKKYKKCCLKN